ncbi:MAG: hypothetical protein K2W96_06435, partial [Gemmataceae bacterium]|nr:hypothetical protein [Gemmataceae bacterium]
AGTPAEPIRALSASADGTRAALLTASGEALLWDRATGKATPLPSPKGARVALLLPDGKAVLTAAPGGKVEQHEGGKAVAVAMPESLAIVLSADGKRLAATHRAGGLWLHDAKGKALKEMQAGERSLRLSLSSDGSSLASIGGAAIQVYDTATGRLRRTLSGHRGGALVGTFSPDGRMLATGGRDRMLRFWEIDTGRERYSPRGQAAPVTAVALSRDGKLIASGTAEGGVQVRTTRGGLLLADRAGHRGPVNALAFLDGKSLASAGEDGALLVWDVAGLDKPAGKPVVLEPAEKADLWKRLAETDPAAAASAQEKLALAGDAGLEDIRRHVKPVDAKKAAKLLKELDDDDFDTRIKAGEALRSRDYEGMLRRVLEGKPSLDLAKRVEKLLREIAEHPEGDHLRALRSVEVLEMAGTAAAKKQLAELAAGAPDADLTRRAKAALSRLP